MAKSAQKTPETTMDKFKKFVRSKRFKTICDENRSLRNFDERDVDTLLTLKHHMDETLSWKQPSKDIKNYTYLQHVIGGMVEDYVNFCEQNPPQRRTHEQPTKNSYAPLNRVNTSSAEFYKKLAKTSNSPM